MDALAVMIAFATFVGVLYLIVRPFLTPEEAPVVEAVSPELVSQKNRIIDAIREIDMDYQTGKLSEEDYQLLRSRYTAAAAEILKRIDAQEEEAAAITEQAVEEPLPEGIDEEEAEALSDAELELEREIAERKTQFKESSDA